MVDGVPDAGVTGGGGSMEGDDGGAHRDDGSDDFVLLYRARDDELVRLAFVLVDSNEQAEELVQEAFARVYLRWQKVDAPWPYLRRTVVNSCHDVLRRRRLERRWLARRHEPDGDDGERHYLDDALASLPSRQRIALVLRYYQGLSEAEIADAMGCPPGTVKSLVHRGTARLREQITP